MMLPQGFIDSISQYPALAPLSQWLLTEPDVSVRLNPHKPGSKSLSMTALGLDAAPVSPVPWCAEGFYLPERPLFTADPQLHQGLYYVQDASSMAITAAIDAIAPAGKPLRYLDCCAAPGGKTTAAISHLPLGSLVVANEYDYKRAQILAENLAKWGSPTAMATRGDTAALQRLPGFFDIVAVDAPCSGEGMMRKDAKAREQWSPGLVSSCASLQRSILSNAYAALRPGGHLIYSTCTFNRQENEENLQWLVDTFALTPVAIPALEAISEIEGAIGSPYPAYRFIPGKVKGEGLFMAVLQKDPEEASARCQMAPSPGSDSKVPKEVSHWLTGDYTLRIIGSEVYAWPKALVRDMATVAAALDAFMPGLHVATIKGKDAVPAHELALSTALNRSALACAEVDCPTALTYLRRESVAVDAPTGYVLLTYRGTPLGFVKNLGKRANNLYPKNWRIRFS